VADSTKSAAPSPWGIPQHLLTQAKVQTDPVHKDIYWNELERLIIDSRPYQRLRFVKQLGTTLKVYPSAEHSRFTHGLGTLKMAQAMIDRVVANRSGQHKVPSLLDEWEADGSIDTRLGEATVLARLSALIHDICHVPFGHTIEDDLKVLTRHDANQQRFRRIWQQLPEDVQRVIEGASTTMPVPGRETRLMVELQRIVLDKLKPPVGQDWSASPYPFVGDVVNNTICADLLDYLSRDHYFTGLPFDLGDRFMDNFYIAPSYIPSSHRERLVVRVTRAGESRTDIVGELLKYLRFRYEITERALYHKSKLAYDAMLGKLLEMWSDALWLDEALTQLPELATEDRLLDAGWLRGRVDELTASAGAAAGDGMAVSEQIDAAVEQELERHFTFFGDEGLIEHLIWTLRAGERKLDSRWRAILRLAEMFRYREHFRMLAHSGGPAVVNAAEDKYAEFGSASKRRILEQSAATWVGLDPAWQIVLWIPGPDMRLKVADVLVESEGMISTLAAFSEDARTIARRHEQLWTVRVYAPATIRDDPSLRDRLLSFIQDQTGLPFIQSDGRRVISTNQLAAEEVVSAIGLERKKVEVITRRLEQVAARTEDVGTYEDLLTMARAIGEDELNAT
jgi:HD superfamily phosphohydrolase